MRKKLARYNTGGVIGSAVGAGATSFIPGVGPLLKPIGGAVGGFLGDIIGGGPQKRRREAERLRELNTPRIVGYATQGYRYGGRMKKYAIGGGLPITQPIGPDADRYVGPTHEEGGIPVNEEGRPVRPAEAVAEVEGGETRQGDYIFSDTLKVPGEDITFAQAHEILLQEGASEEEIQQLAQLQEQVRQEQGLTEEPVMQGGGDLPEVDPTVRKELPRYTLTRRTPDRFPQGVPTVESVDRPQVIPMKKREFDRDKFDSVARTAGYIVPSLTRLGIAAKAPPPERTPRTPTRRVATSSSAFTDARRRQGAAFRSSPNQASHAAYTAGASDLASREAQFRSHQEMVNAQLASQADAVNTQAAMRDSEARAMDTASRIKLVTEAIEMPITAYNADRRGREQQAANIIVSAERISDPKEREIAIRRGLRAVGYTDSEIAEIIRQRKFGGKIKRRK